MQPFGLLSDNRYSSDDPRFALNYTGGGASGSTPTNADVLGRVAYGLTNFGGMQDAAGLLGGPSLRENVSGGNYLDAALQGVGVLPVVGGVAKGLLGGAHLAAAIPAARSIAKAAKPAEAITEAVPQRIVAYHGSPHSFDQFSLDKIGTGEGQQVYGHGLYFAENEDVAKGYRDGLSSSNVVSADGRRFDDMPSHEREVMNYLLRTGKSPSDAVQHFASQVEKDNEMMRTLEMPVSPSSSDPRLEFAKTLSASPDFESVPSGRMYQVKINADPERFLDFDKPLSEQSKAVQTALHDMRPDMTGGQIHESSKLVPGDFFDKKAAAEALKQRGIAGIKYLDQGSRDAKSGSHNYVVFDDKLIDILKKYGLVGLLGGGMTMNASQQQSQPGV
jgi:hypothetical protein